MELFDLPSPILTRIVHFALADDERVASVLLSLSSDAAHATYAALLHLVTLEDDDALLVTAEQTAPSDPATTALAAISRDPRLANAVRQLTILPPSLGRPRRSSDEEGEAGEGLGAHSADARGRAGPDRRDTVVTGAHLAFDELEAQRTEDDETEIVPLDETAFLLLLSRLPALEHFSWSAARTPPPSLCRALGMAAKSLSTFILDPASPTAPPPPAHPTLDPTIHPTQLRWDAPLISNLPVTVVHLSLAQLSSEGVHCLAQAISDESFPALTHLILSRSIFVDDALLDALGNGATRLKTLKISGAGTKLSDKGLRDLFEGCTELDELELDCVEGRLSKACWTGVAPLVSALKTVRITYAEQGPHKSWTADHLDSIASLVLCPTLESFSVSRRPPEGALVPGQHFTSSFPISDVFVPRPMSEKLLEAIIERGEAWKQLGLDFWQIDVESTLKRLLDKTPSLVQLRVLLDSPFKTILSLTSSFALSHSLRKLTVAIDPRHTPELGTLSYGYPPTPTASPHSKNQPLPDPSTFHPFTTTPASPPTNRSPSLGSSSSPLVSAIPESIMPATREWRRFLKKQHKLEAVVWSGRGGVGTWRFDRTSSTSIKIDFEPTHAAPFSTSSPTVGGGHPDHGGRSVSPIRWSKSRPRTSDGAGSQPSSSSLSWRPRRSSSVSLASSCLSDLSPGLGVGIDDPSTSPTALLDRRHSPDREKSFPPFSPSATSSLSRAVGPPTQTVPIPMPPKTTGGGGGQTPWHQGGRHQRSLSLAAATSSFAAAANASPTVSQQAPSGGGGAGGARRSKSERASAPTAGVAGSGAGAGTAQPTIGRRKSAEAGGAGGGGTEKSRKTK